MSTDSLFLSHSSYEYFFDGLLIQVPACKENSVFYSISEKMHASSNLPVLSAKKIFTTPMSETSNIKIKLQVTR